MKKLSILFRTSGGIAPSSQLGFGHIYRTANLANSFYGHEIIFLLEDYGNASSVLRTKGFYHIKKLPKNSTLNSDIKKTTQLIKKYKINLVIIDRYNLKKNYVKKISKFTKVVVISDLWSIDYPADLIFNGFIGYKNNLIKNKYGSKCYVGPKYQIIDSKFSTISSAKKTIDVLATFGGYDENKIIDKLLLIAKEFPYIKFKIILGPGTKNSKLIRDYKRTYKKNLFIQQKTNNMKSEIIQSKFGLCSGGITTYEFISCNVPFGIISQVNHQLLTSKEWERRKLAINFGLVNSYTCQKLEYFFKNFPPSISKHNRIVDGKASKRVYQLIQDELFNL